MSTKIKPADLTEQANRPTSLVPIAPSKPLTTPKHEAQLLERADKAIELVESELARDRQTTRKEPSTRLKVSILMPVYNEQKTLLEIVARVRAQQMHDELLIVDDCSTDGTRELLVELAKEKDIKVLMQGYNRGKGAALRAGLAAVRGDIVLIQDADLEYNPEDYARLLTPLQNRDADVVYGSRFLENAHQDPSWLHRFGNRLLTTASNLTTGLKLTDMETCYKAFRKDLLRGVELRENRFGFEPEFTAKVARQGCRVMEVPVSYNSRDYSEGKKIGLRDAVSAMWCIVRYAIFD